MKRIFSCVLTVCMLVCMCVPAYADGGSMSNFKASEVYTNHFKDVSSSNWAAPSVKTCYEYGLMNGSSETSFSPDGELTIAQALVMADRVHEIYTTGKSTLTNGSPWYQPYIGYAIENGIISSEDFTNYNANATRAQMAHIFYNALPKEEFSAINYVESIPDVTSLTPYAGEIKTLYEAGILTGNDVYGTFAPQKSITRAQAAAIISRVAILSQRRNVTLMKELSWKNNVVITVPQGMEKVDENGVSDTVYSNSECCVVLVSENDPEYIGMDISALTADEITEIIVENYAQEGVVLANATSKLVGFGSVKAYRTDGTVHTAEGEANCAAYTYLYGGTMNVIMYLSYGDAATLDTMASNIKIGGMGPTAVSSAAQTTEVTKPTQSAQETTAPVTASYIGNKSTKVFHLSTCSSVSRMKASNKVSLSSRAAAVNAGYRACSNCKP